MSSIFSWIYRLVYLARPSCCLVLIKTKQQRAGRAGMLNLYSQDICHHRFETRSSGTFIFLCRILFDDVAHTFAVPLAALAGRNGKDYRQYVFGLDVIMAFPCLDLAPPSDIIGSHASNTALRTNLYPPQVRPALKSNTAY